MTYLDVVLAAEDPNRLETLVAQVEDKLESVRSRKELFRDVDLHAFQGACLQERALVDDLDVLRHPLQGDDGQVLPLGYLYGPHLGTSKEVVMDQLPQGRGLAFRVELGWDTMVSVFPSLFQIRNCSFLPIGLAAAGPFSDAKLRRVNGPHPEVYSYEAAHAAVLPSAVKRLGAVTLVGTCHTEMGGSVPIYRATAWKGPPGASQDALKKLEARLLALLNHFTREIINRPVAPSLAAAGVVRTHAAYDAGDSRAMTLLGKEHSSQDRGSFPVYTEAALWAFEAEWHCPTTLEAFCDKAVAAGQMTEADRPHFLMAAKHVRYMAVGHLRKAGLDPQGGPCLPVDTGVAFPLVAAAASAKRAGRCARRRLATFFLDPETTDLLPAQESVLSAAAVFTQVWLAVAVEHQLVEPRAEGAPLHVSATTIPVPPEEAEPWTPPALQVPTTSRLHMKGSSAAALHAVVHAPQTTMGGDSVPAGTRGAPRGGPGGGVHASWMGFGANGPKGFTARRVDYSGGNGVTANISLGDGMWHMLAEVAAADGDAAAASAAADLAEHLADLRYWSNQGGLVHLMSPLGGLPTEVCIYEPGRRRALGAAGTLGRVELVGDVMGKLSGLDSPAAVKAGIDGVGGLLDGMRQRMEQVVHVGEGSTPAHRVEFVAQWRWQGGPTPSPGAVFSGVAEVAEEMVARVVTLDPREYLQVTPTSVLQVLFSGYAGQATGYLTQLVADEVRGSGEVDATWYSLLAGMLGALELSISGFGVGGLIQVSAGCVGFYASVGGWSLCALEWAASHCGQPQRQPARNAITRFHRALCFLPAVYPPLYVRRARVPRCRQQLPVLPGRHAGRPGPPARAVCQGWPPRPRVWRERRHSGSTTGAASAGKTPHGGSVQGPRSAPAAVGDYGARCF